LSLVSLHAAAPEAQSTPLVLELKLDREVEPILATYIDEGLADAAHRQAALVLITMDTPGGLSDSMTDMIHHILESPVPVAVFVFLPPARAALPPASSSFCPQTSPPWRRHAHRRLHADSSPWRVFRSCGRSPAQENK